MKKLVPVLLLSLIFTSCVFMPQPKKFPANGKTLIVGRIIYEGSGLSDYHVNMNGISKRNIRLTIKKCISGSEPVELITGNEGLFYFFGDAKTKYRTESLYLKREGINGGWSSTGKSAIFSFTTADVGVSNIGTIYWYQKKKNSSVRRDHLYSDEVKELFIKMFPKNIWVNEVWSDII